MTPKTTERDLVEEVEELLATHSIMILSDDREPGCDGAPLLRRLVDENKALRAHVADLNHDMEASNRHCEEYHYERPVE